MRKRKGQGTSEKDQRINGKHQRKFSFSLGLNAAYRLINLRAHSHAAIGEFENNIASEGNRIIHEFSAGRTLTSDWP